MASFEELKEAWFDLLAADSTLTGRLGSLNDGTTAIIQAIDPGPQVYPNITFLFLNQEGDIDMDRRGKYRIFIEATIKDFRRDTNNRILDDMQRVSERQTLSTTNFITSQIIFDFGNEINFENVDPGDRNALFGIVTQWHFDAYTRGI